MTDQSHVEMKIQMLAQAASILAAMSNPKRLEILTLLVQRRYSAGELASCVGLSQSATSQHLSKFRSHKMVKTKRQGQTIFYSDPSDAVRRILVMLSNI